MRELGTLYDPLNFLGDARYLVLHTVEDSYLDIVPQCALGKGKLGTGDR